jgi:hypothetical protein
MRKLIAVAAAVAVDAAVRTPAVQIHTAHAAAVIQNAFDIDKMHERR